MELREPPRSPQPPPPDRLVRSLLFLNLMAVLALGLLFLWSSGSPGDDRDTAELERQVASKLQTAGAIDTAAPLYERYLAASDAAPEARARIAISVGNIYLRQGAYSKALRWYYEAETLGAGELSGELGEKIVHTLERLGRHHAAKAALDSRVQLTDDNAVQRAADDPVLATIGVEEIYRSDLDRALDDLPPEASAASVTTTAQKQEFLKKYVADELLWRKAAKLEYDRDPEVERRHAQLLKQLAVGKFVEHEVVGKIVVDEADLRNFFEANSERYAEPASDDAPAKEPSFDDVRQVVERDYRMQKIQSEYNKIIESELSTEDVQLYPERLSNDA